MLFLSRVFFLTGISVGLVLAATAPTLAVTTNFSGTTAGQPEWQRPSSLTSLSNIGTDVPYEYSSFQVDVSGSYNMSTITSGWDGYLFLYNNTGFSPTNQLQGLLALDDGSTLTTSTIISTLNAGETYYYVQSGYANSDSGAYTGTFNGPGVVTFGSVPVPGPLGFLGAGAALACSRKLRRRHKLGQKLSSTTTLN